MVIKHYIKLVTNLHHTITIGNNEDIKFLIAINTVLLFF